MRAFALLALALALAACASRPDADATVEVVPLDEAVYAAEVHAVVERRCGSIDCHGQLPRGLRVYGARGLRLPNDAGLRPGVGDTTREEVRATYESIVGLEPERTNALVLSGARDVYGVLFLTKPLALERHRGGASLRRGEPAERCLASWLADATDAVACASARAD